MFTPIIIPYHVNIYTYIFQVVGIAMASNQNSRRLSRAVIAEIAPISDDDQDFIANSPPPSEDSDSDSNTWKAKVKKKKFQQSDIQIPCKVRLQVSKNNGS